MSTTTSNEALISATSAIRAPIPPITPNPQLDQFNNSLMLYLKRVFATLTSDNVSTTVGAQVPSSVRNFELVYDYYNGGVIWRPTNKWWLTPDVFDDTISYFGNGLDYPAGNYRIWYVYGALMPGVIMGVPVGWGIDYTINLHQIIYNNGGQTDSGMWDTTVYTNQADCEAANILKYYDFTHTGGTIGMNYFGDTDYNDNQEGNPSPTFMLVPNF